MKRSLKELLPAAPEHLAEFGVSLGREVKTGGEAIDEDTFVARAAAARTMAGYQCGTHLPTSLVSLVRVAREALGMQERRMREAAGVSAVLWKQVVTGRVPPYVLRAEQWAKLGGTLRLGYEAVEATVLSSFRQYATQAVGDHAKFARSKIRQKAPPGYAAELADAFGELRMKSAARRTAGSGDRRLSGLLGEIRRCMSAD